MKSHTIGRALLVLFVALVVIAMFLGPGGPADGAARVDAGGERSEVRDDLGDVDLARDAIEVANDGPRAGGREEIVDAGASGAPDVRLWRDLVRPVDDLTRAAVEGVAFEVVLESTERFIATLEDPFDERVFAEPAVARATVDGYCVRVFDLGALDGRGDLPVDLRLAPTASVVVRFADDALVPMHDVCNVDFAIDRFVDPEAVRLGSTRVEHMGTFDVLERNLAALFGNSTSDDIREHARPSWLLGTDLSDLLFDVDGPPVDAIFGERTVALFGDRTAVIDGIPASRALSIRVRPHELFVLSFDLPDGALDGVPPTRHGSPVPFTLADDPLEVVIDVVEEPGAILGAFGSQARDIGAYAMTVESRGGIETGGEARFIRRIEPNDAGAWIVDDVLPGPFRVKATWFEGERFLHRAELSGDLAPGERRDLGLIEARSGHRLTVVPRVEIDGVAWDPSSDARFADAEWSFAVYPVVDGRITSSDQIGGGVVGFEPCGIVGLETATYDLHLFEPELAAGVGADLRYDGWTRTEVFELSGDRTVDVVVRYATVAHTCRVSIDTAGVEEVLPGLRYWARANAREVTTGEVVSGRDPDRYYGGGLPDHVHLEFPLGPGTWEITAALRVDQYSLDDHRPLELETLREFRGYFGRATLDVVTGGEPPAPVTIELQPGVTLIGPRDAFTDDPEARPPGLVATVEGVESAAYPIQFHDGATIVYLGLIPGASYRDEASGFAFLAPIGGGVHELAGVGD